MCFGCACSDDPDPQSVYFVLFDTMCGRSALHLRFDGKPTEMTALIGDVDGTGGWSGKCGTDYTIDFLSGFAGYEYQKITDIVIFKSEITGYDGDTPISSYYSTGQGNNTQEKRTITLSYEAIKTIYMNAT